MYGERPLTRCFGGVVFVIDGYTRGFRCRPNLDLESFVECSNTFSGRLLISCILPYDPCSGVDDRD